MWIALALTAALFFGVRGILYLWVASRGHDTTTFMAGVFLSGFILSALGALATAQSWENVWSIGGAMAVSSIAANVFLFKGFAVGKPSVIALLSSLPPALVVVLAYWVWGEVLSIGQLLAFAFIFAGVVIVRSAHRIHWHDLQGAHWGVLALISFAITDLLGKQSTRMGADLLPTLTIVFLIGFMYFAGVLTWKRLHAPKLTSASFPSKSTVWLGLLIGVTNVGGMICIVSAFADGFTGLVSAIVATNVLLVVLYTRIRRIEPWHAVESIGMACSLLGVVLLQLL